MKPLEDASSYDKLFFECQDGLCKTNSIANQIHQIIMSFDAYDQEGELKEEFTSLELSARVQSIAYLHTALNALQMHHMVMQATSAACADRHPYLLESHEA